MIVPLRLSRDEVRVVAEILAHLSRRCGYRLSLNGLLQKWTTFVGQVELGYTDNVYEHANDLSARGLLMELIAASPVSVQGKMEPVLRPWDERFRAATEETAHALLPGMDEQPRAWWWFRLPKKLVGELILQPQIGAALIGTQRRRR